MNFRNRRCAQELFAFTIAGPGLGIDQQGADQQHVRNHDACQQEQPLEWMAKVVTEQGAKDDHDPKHSLRHHM